MPKNISPQPQNQWMIVYIAYNLPEAHIVAGRLQSEGIPAMVYQVAGANAMGIHIGSIGEIKVLVHPSDYEVAVAILEPEDDDLDTLPDHIADITYLGADDHTDDDDNDDE